LAWLLLLMVSLLDLLLLVAALHQNAPQDPEKVGLSQADALHILKQLAKACKQQGAYHLACKKYTQVRA
jgi:hypothetical protein